MLDEGLDAATDPEAVLEATDDPADEAGRRPAGAPRQRTGGARRAALAEGVDQGMEGEGGAAEGVQEGAEQAGERQDLQGSYAAPLAQRMAWPGEGGSADGAPRCQAAGQWPGAQSVLAHATAQGRG